MVARWSPNPLGMLWQGRAYQPLAFEQIREDLRFVLGRMHRPRVAWHDPNFGVRFNDYMTTIEEAVPAGSIDFVAESSLYVVRAISSEGFGRLRYNSTIRRLLDTDSAVRQFFDGEIKVLPTFYKERIRRDLGPLWDMLPPAALFHDHSAYLAAHEAQTARVPARGVA